MPPEQGGSVVVGREQHPVVEPVPAGESEHIVQLRRLLAVWEGKCALYVAGGTRERLAAFRQHPDRYPAAAEAAGDPETPVIPREDERPRRRHLVRAGAPDESRPPRAAGLERRCPPRSGAALPATSRATLRVAYFVPATKRMRG